MTAEQLNDLNAILNASGWAINREMRFSMKRARGFAKCVALPRWPFVAALVVACALETLAGASGLDAERIGVCSWSFQKPIRDVSARMEQAGVRGIHLALGPFVAPDERHGAKAAADDWDFVKAQVKSGKWKLFSTMIAFPQEDYSTLASIRKTGGIVPDADWPKNQEIVRKAVALSKELEAPYLSLHAGFLDATDAKALSTFVARVSWMRDECRKAGLELILESGQETAAELVDFLKSVPGVGVNFDPANMILYGKGCPMAAIDRLLPHIRQVHIKDAVASAKHDEWGAEVPWGEGEVGGRAFVEKLLKLGYRGNFAIEREGGEQRTEDILQAVKLLREFPVRPR